MKLDLMKTAKWMGICLLVIKLVFLVIVIFWFDFFLILLEHHSPINPFEVIYYSSDRFHAETEHRAISYIYPDSDTAEIFTMPYNYLHVTPLPANFPSARLKPRKGPYGIKYNELTSIYWDTLTSAGMGDRKAIIYSGHGNAIWIKVSGDRGKTWKHLYTGLYQKNSYVLMADENMTLWKNDSTLQLRIRIHRMMVVDVSSKPDGPSGQTTSDRFVAEINLKKLSNDSDGDGLTDIMEMRYMTNLHSADSDNDDITDDKDLNPRFPGSFEPKSLLYSAFLEDRIYVRPLGKPAYFPDEILTPVKILTGNILTPATLVVTDEPELQKIIPCNITGTCRYIMMTTEEYRKYLTTFANDLDGYPDRVVSLLYPSDLFPEAYWIETHGSYFRCTYFVKRTRHGWKVFDLGGYIS
jgi:hypothetical protein